MQRETHLEIDSWAADGRAALRRCDHPACAEEGLYRAPKDRERLDEYFWFCLAHVREYNLGWNYFAGMNERDIERIRRRDTVWERPTWPFAGPSPHFKVRDFFDLFEDENSEPKRGPDQAPRRASPEAEALAVFALEGPVTLIQVKARYKELVKRHHPDIHGGDKAAEERLKVINQAYTTLKSSIPA